MSLLRPLLLSLALVSALVAGPSLAASRAPARPPAESADAGAPLRGPGDRFELPVPDGWIAGQRLLGSGDWALTLTRATPVAAPALDLRGADPIVRPTLELRWVERGDDLGRAFAAAGLGVSGLQPVAVHAGGHSGVAAGARDADGMPVLATALRWSKGAALVAVAAPVEAVDLDELEAILATLHDPEPDAGADPAHARAHGTALSLAPLPVPAVTASVLRVPMPDGVYATITSGLDNAPISDHGGRSPGSSFARPHQLYGLDFQPVAGSSNGVVAPVTSTILWKTTDALGLAFNSEGRRMSVGLAHFNVSAGVFQNILTVHGDGSTCGLFLGSWHYHGSGGPTNAFTQGASIGNRSTTWIHVSLEHYQSDAARIPVPFSIGHVAPPYTFTGDYSIEGTPFPASWDPAGTRKEYNFYSDANNGGGRQYAHGDMDVPPAATPVTSVGSGRWVTRFYALNSTSTSTNPVWNVDAAPSYYRVYSGSILDFDGQSFAWNPEPNQVRDWPPNTLVQTTGTNPASDITRFRAVFEGTFNFGTSAPRRFGLTHTHGVITYIDGVQVPALSGDAGGGTTPVVRTYDATLANTHTIKIVYTMGPRNAGAPATRARLLFRWEKCNGIDDNGNGLIDEDNACHCTTRLNFGKTYRFCDFPLTRSQAVAACGGASSHLVKVESATEGSWIAGNTNGRDRWTGLNDIVSEGVWRWQDGSLLGSYRNWSAAEPNGGASENCMMMWPSGLWNDLNCTWTVPFVCESADAEVCDGVDNDGDGQVDEGNVCQCTTRTNAGKTYRFCNTRLTRDQAAQACATDGSQLVKIESATESSWIAANTGGLERWSGLNDVAAESTWRWQDGTLLGAYRNWSAAEPNGGTSENCMMIWPSGLWNDLNCAWDVQFLCEK